jgi:hypothetical protein
MFKVELKLISSLSFAHPIKILRKSLVKILYRLCGDVNAKGVNRQGIEANSKSAWEASALAENHAVATQAPPGFLPLGRS